MLLPVVASLSYLVVLSTGVAGNPIFTSQSRASHGITLSITKNSSLAGPTSFVPKDRARLSNLANVATGVQQLDASDPNGVTNVLLDDLGTVYATNVGIGNPPNSYYLIIDTGSANTWVGAFKPYRKTNTSVDTGDSVLVYYGRGFFEGNEYNDTVTISPGVEISQQSIGVANVSDRLYPFDGILGIGPQGLTSGTLFSDRNGTIPTVTDNLFEQGKIGQNVVSVSFEPSNESAVTIGELSFGGIDSTKCIGDINYVPITDTYPSSSYWGVNASLYYGGDNGTSPPSCTLAENIAGIVDTGTSFLYIATHAYNSYVRCTGAVYDHDTGLLHITKEKYEKLQSFFLDIGGNKYELIPDAQIFPRKLNTNIGGREGRIYLIIQDIGQSKPGLEFIAGMVFLERFLSVFDTQNHRVGLAPTQNTNAKINW